MTRMSLRIPGPLSERLKATAHRRGLSESSVVREALEKHLVNEAGPESLYEALDRLGLARKSRGPKRKRGLWEDPKAMEGFGER